MKWLILVILLLAMPCYADEIDDLVPFIIQAGSSGNSNAVSSKGAIGLMGVTPIVLREYIQEMGWAYKGMDLPCKKDLYNPERNVIIGTWYLRRLRDHYLKYQISLLYSTPCNGIDVGLTFHNQHFNNDEAALCMILGAYNMGPTRLKKLNYQWWRIEETKNYVFKVMKLYKGGNNG